MDERTLARFMSKVEVQPNGCWHFTGKHGANGYTYFWLDGKNRLAHRVAFTHFKGPIPDGHEVEHACHSRDESCTAGSACPHRQCVNPDDLEALLPIDNIMRSRGLAAANVVKDHCANGHPFDDENTYVYPSGERACRICRADAVKAWTTTNRPAAGPHCRDRRECPQGHPYDEKNTIINAQGRRVCRICRRTSDREAKRRARAAARQQVA